MRIILNNILIRFNSSNFIRNSFWGLVARMVETLFLSLFFVIISRNFSTQDFSYFLIATNIYQLVVGFSSMGLGTWFIRELEHEPDKPDLINRFFKIQTGLGLLFCSLNVILVFILYQDKNIRLLSVILGTNILFDNVIYAIKSLNIAESQQKKSAIIMTIDGFMKFFISCLLFVYPFSILTLSILLVAVRLFTVNLFIQMGTSTKINLRFLWNFKISFLDVRKHVVANWRFVVIVGLSIVFWRSATIIVSKFLTLKDVADYEVAYKIFSVFLILPIVASTSIYPQFVKYFAKSDYTAIKKFYSKIFLVYAILCALSYAFIQSFGDVIIPFIFGHNYLQAADCLKKMFLTFLVFPTALLQANLLVAMKQEKIDMYFNMVALAVNFIGCFVGLYFDKSLSVVNYSIFGSFVLFHFLQNILLNKLKLTSLKNSIIFYTALPIFIFIYQYAIKVANNVVVFVCVCLAVAISLAYYFYRNYKKKLYTFHRSEAITADKL